MSVDYPTGPDPEATEDSPAPTRPAGRAIGAERDLILGLLAFQHGFIEAPTLVDAVHAWVADKARPLGANLVEWGALDDRQLAALEALAPRPTGPIGGDAPPGATASVTIDLDEPTDRGEPTLPADTGRARGDASGAGPRDRADGRHGCRYRILRPHARGGLGEVFLAEDLELGRRVALKEIQARHEHDPQSRARFLLEGEVTGGLEHPGIVPVYGLGAYPDGRPYYAMRFIRGESLKQAIARGRGAGAPAPDLRKLLRRFLAVCDAVEYAHSRGVLHRDLKPANIMLGKFGETLVVDWGLAKVVGKPDDGHPPDDVDVEGPIHPSAASGVEPTRMDSVYGTPQYMSPEQAAGRVDRIGPASDVYGLGSTLYYLLTGRAPFPERPLPEIRPRILVGEFPRPREVDGSIPRPLESICLRAMATEPVDRYASARALADDIESYLADQPVAAHPDPPSARLARWSRRHRPVVAGAAALLVAAVVGLAVNNAMVRAEQANTDQQRRRAEGALARVLDTLEITAEAVEQTMIGIASDELAHVPRMEPVRRKLTDEALEVARKITQGWPDDPNVARLAAPILHRAANLDRTLGQPGRASASYREALRLYDAALAAGHPEARDLRANAAGVAIDSAEALRMDGRLDQALARYDEARGRAERMRAEAPGDPIFELPLARSLYNKAEVLLMVGRLDEAREAEARALALMDRVVNRNRRRPELRLLRTFPLRGLAVVASRSGRLDDAGPAFDRAMANLDLVEPPIRGNNDEQFVRSSVLEERGWWLAQVPGRLAEAERSHGEAVAILSRLTAEYPKIPHFRVGHAVALLGRASARAGMGPDRRPEAEADARESRRILEEVLDDFLRIPEARGWLGQALGLLGRLSADRDAALALLGRAVVEQGRALDANRESPRDRAALRRHEQAIRERGGP